MSGQAGDNRRATRRIGKRVVDALKPGQIVWDSEVKGFGVRCQRGAKIYVLKARAKGRQRWITIGRHGSPWTAEKARQRASRLRGAIADGHDPAQARDDAKGAPTVAALCDRFLSDYAAHHKRESSRAADARNIRNHVLPLLGQLKVADVTRADIDRLKRAVKDGRTARDEKAGPRARIIVTGGPGAANRCLALLSRMFNLAERWGYRPDGSNPTRHVDKYRERKFGRFLSEAEMARLAAALSEAEAAGSVTPHVAAAVRLLIFTGCRRDEILGLHWADVDTDNALLRLPAGKTGARIVYLNAPALEVLANIPRLDANPFVIAGEKDAARLVNLEKPWRRLRERATLAIWRDDPSVAPIIAKLEKGRRKALTAADVQEAAATKDMTLPAGLLDVRLHDLRHSFASVAVAGGLSLPMVGKLLGHTQPQTTARYGHLAADPVRAAGEAIGQKIAAAMKGAAGAEVVPLRQVNR